MEDDQSVYRLEGSNDNEVGGLIITKKPSDHEFKKPQTSIFGLDKLAEQKRRENSLEPNRSNSSPAEYHNDKKRRYRNYSEETPTHTGGVNKSAKEKLAARLERQKLDAKRDKRNRDRDRDEYRDRDRNRDRDRDRDRARSRSKDWSRHGDQSSRRDTTPRFRDEPLTPKYRVKVTHFCC